MAIKELLIKAVDAHHPDIKVDGAGCYKKGDVVCIMPEGHEWGAKECLPKFLVVKADISDVEAADLVLSELSPLVDKDGKAEIRTRRKYNFDFETHLGKIRLGAIKESGWRVEGIDKRNIRDKTVL